MDYDINKTGTIFYFFNIKASRNTNRRPGGQPNPFENDIPAEIDDRPVEDYIGEGEDRPGEGKHF